MKKTNQSNQQEVAKVKLVKAYLGYQGYSIFKDTLPVEDQHAIRKELMVHAHIPKSPIQPAPFPVYRESQLKLYVPRYFGLERWGPNIENKSCHLVTLLTHDIHLRAYYLTSNRPVYPL